MATNRLPAFEYGTRPIYPGMARNDVTGATIAALALAQKSRSPFVGIAIAGQGTICIKRELFKQSLKGLRIIDAEIVTANEDGEIRATYRPSDETSWGTRLKEAWYAHGWSCDRALRVYAIGPHVKATRLFLSQNVRSYEHRRTIEAYQQAEAKRRERPAVKESKYQKKIAQLERKLAKTAEASRPHNPVLAISHCEFNTHMRTRWHLWTLQKPVRRAIQQIARQGISSTQLYAEVAKLIAPGYACVNEDEVSSFYRYQTDYANAPKRIYQFVPAAPLTVRKWSEIGERDRERLKLDNMWDYRTRLWEFCGLAAKPWHYQQDQEYDASYRAVWGYQHYQHWTELRNERRQIEEEIQAVRVLEADASTRKQ